MKKYVNPRKMARKKQKKNKTGQKSTEHTNQRIIPAFYGRKFQISYIGIDRTQNGNEMVLSKALNGHHRSRSSGKKFQSTETSGCFYI